MKALAVDTIEVFKDDGRVRKLLRKGKYAEVAEHVFATSVLQPDFDADAVLDAADEGEVGLMALAVDAAYADQVAGLDESWLEIQATMAVLPSLTWPKGIKFAK